MYIYTVLVFLTLFIPFLKISLNCLREGALELLRQQRTPYQMLNSHLNHAYCGCLYCAVIIVFIVTNVSEQKCLDLPVFIVINCDVI